MFIVVTGGSGSGKSAYAEKRIAQFGELDRYYIATMENRDKESEKRIKRHRQMRSDKNFITIESPKNLDKITLSTKGVILLECMSNLVANELFSAEGMADPLEVEEKIISGVEKLLPQTLHAVIVTNEVFSDGLDYDPWTQAYISCLGRINQRIAEKADEVVEVVYSIPLMIKG